MTEHPDGRSSDDGVESGALDDELQEAQEGRGYGEDEGEREDALGEDGE